MSAVDTGTFDSTLTASRGYRLVCAACGRRQDDDGTVLDCPGDHPPALLRSDYAERRFSPRPDQDGLFRYADWLPVVRTLDGAGRTAVYRSAGLARALGIGELWIAFNGYWPERGAFLETGTFKEFEAYTVLGRLPERAPMLTVASSGNTGAAFAWACTRVGAPCLLVVPARGLGRLRLPARLDPRVTLVVVEDGGYPEAIELAAAAARRPGFQLEGGVKNVGRRDGLGTVMLAAFDEMRRLPTHYFQAVGSGAGAIAVLEAAKRLRAGSCADPLPRLLLCQNDPFAPLHDSWRSDPAPLDDAAQDRLRASAAHVLADELTNLTPPYAVTGGVRDALHETDGDVLTADNAAVQKARDMFRELEGTDIEPAAGVAVACLDEAAARGVVGRDSVVLLNITGGGRERLAEDYDLVPAEPTLTVRRADIGRPETLARIAGFCERFV